MYKRSCSILVSVKWSNYQLGLMTAPPPGVRTSLDRLVSRRQAGFFGVHCPQETMTDTLCDTLEDEEQSLLMLQKHQKLKLKKWLFLSNCRVNAEWGTGLLKEAKAELLNMNEYTEDKMNKILVKI